jgi:hypothetical protein
MILVLGISLAAILVSLRAGYLWGVRAGMAERERLAGELRGLDARIGRPERERISRDLAKFSVSQGEKRDLTRLLDRIASVGRLETVLLSNEEGLPLASNTEAGNTERLAASLARIALAIDQTIDRDGAAPRAFLLCDRADELTFCRAFHVNGQRLFFTVVSNDLPLTAADVDSAISKIEAALTINAISYV